MAIVEMDGKAKVPGFRVQTDKVLALDLGKTCGWAVLSGGQLESGIVKFELHRGESTGMRFVRFNAWLDEMLGLLSPKLVVYEMAHHRGGHATELLLGMVTRVQEACARYGVQYTSIHSACLKKTATGSGKASKEDMIKAAVALVRREVLDDNEADAILLLKVAKADGLV